LNFLARPILLRPVKPRICIRGSEYDLWFHGRVCPRNEFVLTKSSYTTNCVERTWLLLPIRRLWRLGQSSWVRFANLTSQSAPPSNARLKHLHWLGEPKLAQLTSGNDQGSLLACTTKMSEIETFGEGFDPPGQLCTPQLHRPTSSRLVRLFTCQRACETESYDSLPQIAVSSFRHFRR